MGEPEVWKPDVCRGSGQNQIEHGRIMARRTEQHETVPDHILEAQALPCMEDYPETVEQATGEDEPERQLRQRGKPGVLVN
jgi:hypothetical protein